MTNQKARLLHDECKDGYVASNIPGMRKNNRLYVAIIINWTLSLNTEIIGCRRRYSGSSDEWISANLHGCFRYVRIILGYTYVWNITNTYVQLHIAVNFFSFFSS